MAAARRHHANKRAPEPRAALAPPAAVYCRSTSCLPRPTRVPESMAFSRTGSEMPAGPRGAPTSTHNQPAALAVQRRPPDTTQVQ